jgi:hypothetical protein
MQAAPRGHAALGERAPPALMVLFAHIADRAADPNTSPAFGFKKEERRKQPTVKLRTCLRQKKKRFAHIADRATGPSTLPAFGFEENAIETTRSETPPREIQLVSGIFPYTNRCFYRRQRRRSRSSGSRLPNLALQRPAW